jgi:hypothetical protein
MAISRKWTVFWTLLRPRMTPLANRAGLYWLIVFTTLDSDRVLLADEYLSCALTMSSYFASVVTGFFGTMCTIL